MRSALVLCLFVSCAPPASPEGQPATETAARPQPSAMVTVSLSASSADVDEPPPETTPREENLGAPTAKDEEDHADAGHAGSGGETDRVRVLAARTYRNRLMAFFKSGFTCAAPSTCAPAASFVIAKDKTVTSVVFTPCGDTAHDARANQHARTRVGKKIPPPPNAWAFDVPPTMSVVYHCR